MTPELCYGFLCFISLESDGPKFFGFSEFLAALALMVLAWTTADIRYRFRVRIAPIPLHGITFAVVALIGTLTLLTDLWRAEQWWVPRGNLLTPASWQALMGGVFLITFLVWAWFAFIRPPVYGRMNAKRFAQTLYHIIVKGSPTETAVIADELTRSARYLVHHATEKVEPKSLYIALKGETQRKQRKVAAYANDLLLLIADRRFCRVIVESSPITALAFFLGMSETRKYGIQVEIFAKNIMNEAINCRDSFMFHESEPYESGLIGYYKPLTYAMYSNYTMVEKIGTLFDPDIAGHSKWDAAQWKAYCRIVLMAFRDYVNTRFSEHSFILYRATSNIETAASDIYKLNGLSEITWDNDALARLRVVVQFIKDAIEILDKKGVPERIVLRIREKEGRHTAKTFYDKIARMIFEVVFSASGVRSPRDECWWVQHNAIWSEIFNFSSFESAAGKVVKFKTRRLLYNQITRMKRFPNFKSARFIGFCLNVMGINMASGDNDKDKDSRALHKAVLAWVRKNYAWLHGYNPRVAEACLVDGITYDAENLRLVRTYPAEGLRLEPHYVYLKLDPAPAKADESATNT